MLPQCPALLQDSCQLFLLNLQVEAWPCKQEQLNPSLSQYMKITSGQKYSELQWSCRGADRQHAKGRSELSGACPLWNVCCLVPHWHQRFSSEIGIVLKNKFLPEFSDTEASSLPVRLSRSAVCRKDFFHLSSPRAARPLSGCSSEQLT